MRCANRINQQRRGLAVAFILSTGLLLVGGDVKSDKITCWSITDRWEMCSNGEVQEFHPQKNEPFFALELDGHLVANSWSLQEYAEEIAHIGDRALWRKIKEKLVADLGEMGANYQSITRHGVEFIEWSYDVGGDMYFFAAAMIDDKEALVTTHATKVPARFDIARAHEVFMKNTRLRPNE